MLRQPLNICENEFLKYLKFIFGIRLADTVWIALCGFYGKHEKKQQ